MSHSRENTPVMLYAFLDSSCPRSLGSPFGSQDHYHDKQRWHPEIADDSVLGRLSRHVICLLTSFDLIFLVSRDLLLGGSRVLDC